MSKTPALCISVCVVVLVNAGCFVRRRAIQAPAARQMGPVLTASKDELIQRLHALFDPIRSFEMRAELSPSVLNPAKGTATDYATVSAYILFRRPDDIRVLGKDPVLGSTIFDMVSTGNQFRVSIPPKKLFIIGDNNAPPASGNKLENLRPSALLNSLTITPPDPVMDVTLLENDDERALYILLIIRRDQQKFELDREVYFDGRTLGITRQKTFDPTGKVLSDARYADWKPYDGTSYPTMIDIQRPQDNYEVQLSVTSLELNSPNVTDARLVLPQPADYQIKEIK